MITEHEEARRALMQRLDHLQVVSAQHVTYLAPLRPAIDPEIEDVPEFIDDDLSNRRERRLDLSQKAKGRFRAREVG
jgi:coproporphyrinogen III oxidase-like Fe-S oxidoreductase